MIPILREADTDRAKIFAREDPVYVPVHTLFS